MRPPAVLPPEAAPPATDRSTPSRLSYGGTLRAGLYIDGDRTTVFRSLGALTLQGRRLSLNASLGVDVVSSASVDVRSSPSSAVDVVTSASGRSRSSVSMSDRRVAGSLGVGWRDGAGKTVTASASYANETDYDSLGGAVGGSWDLAERTITLLGGVAATRNWVGSRLDSTFARDLYTTAYTVGIAPVLSPRDVLRLRYDGAYASGYQGSPYRNVRFGNWSTTRSRDGRITFTNTTGAAAGALERLPDERLRHALVLDWLHALGPRWALSAQLRGSTDSWGVQSISPGLELRYASPSFRFRLGYRFYAQSGADFYQTRYLLSEDKYDYYTSDKELSRELGHVANAGVSFVLAPARAPGDNALLLEVGATVLRYEYPEFALLSARTSGWIDAGLTWEL